MASFTDRVKSAAYTELEVGAVIVGAAASAKFLHRDKIFKDHDKDKPSFMYKNFDLLTAGGAVLASTYVQNPWLKLLLMGVALKGTTGFIREKWVDKDTHKSKLPVFDSHHEEIKKLDQALQEQAANFHAMSEAQTEGRLEGATPEHSAVAEALRGATPEHSAVADRLGAYNYALTNETSVAACGMDEF